MSRRPEVGTDVWSQTEFVYSPVYFQCFVFLQGQSISGDRVEGLSARQECAHTRFKILSIRDSCVPSRCRGVNW